MDSPASSPPRRLRLDRPFATGAIAAAGVLCVATAWRSILLLAPLLLSVAVAALLATALQPVVHRLRRGGIAQGPAIAIVSTVMLGVLVVTAMQLAPVVAAQAGLLHTQAERQTTDGTLDAVAAPLQQLVPVAVLDVTEVLHGAVLHLTTGPGLMAVSHGMLGAGTALSTGAFAAATVLALTVYFLASGRWFLGQLLALLPAGHRARTLRTVRDAGRRISRYVRGLLLLALLNGVLSLAVLLATGASLPLLCAVVAALCTLLPLIGIPAGGLLVVGTQALLAPPGAPAWIGLALWYGLYIVAEAYVIAPRVIGRSVELPGTVILLATLAGAALHGMAGALLAVPAVVAGAALLRARKGL